MHVEIDQLVASYERRTISRRALIEALATIALSTRALAYTGPPESLVRARTLNHVTITTADVARSKAFYQKLAGLRVRDEGKDFCELQLEGAFLGLYPPEEAGDRQGFDHLCLGVESYDPKRLLERLQQAVPEAKPRVSYGDQLYLWDPDGVQIQFADVNYKH